MTPTRLIDTEKSRIKNLADGRHILGIQDTTEINYQAHNGRTHGSGAMGVMERPTDLRIIKTLQ